MKKKSVKNDAILIVILLLLAGSAYVGMRFYQKQNTHNAVLMVTIDGMEYGAYPLHTDVTKKIELADGSYNLLLIEDGKADVIEASCPDKVCVQHRAIDKKNQSIVCLPNRVVIRVENGDDSGVDATTQ